MPSGSGTTWRAQKPRATEAQSDLRELQFLKNQYGSLGEKVALRYQNGLFLPEAGISSLEKRAAEQRTEEAFLTLLAQFTQQGRNVSHTKTAPNYAPAEFAKAQKGIRKEAFADAMQRLFATDRIHVESYGRPSRQASKLAAGKAPPCQSDPG
jgi:RecA-family ATPase